MTPGSSNTARGLARVAKAAEEAGVTLALELLNSKIDHPDYQCDHTAWGVQVINQVNSPAVKLLYDVYHMQVMEGDVIRTIETHHDAFAHYHVAGNPGRHEPDRGQELWYPAIYRAIAATGYDGYVGMEFVPRGDPIASRCARRWRTCGQQASRESGDRSQEWPWTLRPGHSASHRRRPRVAAGGGLTTDEIRVIPTKMVARGARNSTIDPDKW